MVNIQGKIESGTQIIFNKTLYHYGYKQSKKYFICILINDSHKSANFWNQIIEHIPRSGLIDPETINPHKLRYKSLKHAPDCLFGKLRIKDFNDVPHFPKRKNNIKLNLNEYIFYPNGERNIRWCCKTIQKAIYIPIDINQTNKQFSVTVQQKFM